MKTIPRKRCATVARFTSVFAIAIVVPSLGGCALESSEEAAASGLPAPGAVEIIQPLTLADRARVPEKEPGFVSAEVEDGRLVISHDGTLRPFAEGDVLSGTQGGGYLVRVLAARALDPTRIAMDTTPADLTELITEGHFRVHYDAEAYARDLDQYLAELSEAELQQGEPIARAAQALKKTGGPMRLLDIYATRLPASCGVGADGTAELDATADLTPVLDVEVEIGRREGINPLPELKRFRSVLSGRLDVRAKLHGTGTVTGFCSVDLFSLIGGVVSLPLPTLTFWVGSVPVIITSEIGPVAEAELGLSFTGADFVAEAQSTTTIEAGVDYKNHDWNLIWQPSCRAHGSASIGEPGPITAHGMVSAGGELRARLYGVLGPNIGIAAYARASAQSAAPYCTYDAWTDGGVYAYAEVEAGVSAGPLRLTLARMALVDLDLLHFDGPRTSGRLRDAPQCAARP